MKFLKTLIPLSLVALMFGISACDDEDFEELNSNPNQPESVEPNLLLPGVIRRTTNNAVDNSFLSGNIVAQTATKTLRVEDELYILGSLPELWTTHYGALRDLENIEEQAIESGNDNYQGIALVMEAWLYSVLTDAYGDIPYDQATDGDEGEFTPEYTAQEEVYLGGLEGTPFAGEEPGIIALLDQANGLLDPGGQSVSGDILYGGDVSKWKKFCNSLKLRLLTHLSSRDDQEALISQKMQEVASNPSQFPVFESSEDNAVLSYLEAFPNQFPLIPLKIGDFDAVNLSATADSVMTSLNDPRLQEYARPSNIDDIISASSDTTIEPEYDGLANGFPASADEKATSASRLGYRYYDYPDHPQRAEKAKGIIMTNAELQFILAEARTRGWINTGNAEDFYRNGIVSAMTYYDVSLPDSGSVTSIQEYYDQSEVNLSDASGQQEQLEYIAQQKWLALWFHGLEPFFELRRNLNDQANSNEVLSYLTPAEESNIGNRFPYRFRYPGNAESLNQQEFQSAINSQGANDVTTDIWLTE
jgi:hypothetical protein